MKNEKIYYPFLPRQKMAVAHCDGGQLFYSQEGLHLLQQFLNLLQYFQHRIYILLQLKFDDFKKLLCFFNIVVFVTTN